MDRPEAASDRIASCVERLSHGETPSLQHGNLEGNPYTKRVVKQALFVNDRILGQPGTLCLAPIAAEQ